MSSHVYVLEVSLPTSRVSSLVDVLEVSLPSQESGKSCVYVRGIVPKPGK